MSADKIEDKKDKKEPLKAKQEKKIARPEFSGEKIIRILSTDVPGNKDVYVGLTNLKGVSWSFSSAVCASLGIDKKKKISELSKEEIASISEFIKHPRNIPDFLFNRRKDFESGKTLHLIGSDLDIQKEFDIKRLKKIRSYRGWRHATGQPSRGQRTKSHFRKAGKKKAVGVQSKPKVGKKG